MIWVARSLFSATIPDFCWGNRPQPIGHRRRACRSVRRVGLQHGFKEWPQAFVYAGQIGYVRRFSMTSTGEPLISSGLPRSAAAITSPRL